jgi:hypothetical protein
MNEKKAKALRRLVRDLGHPVKEIEARVVKVREVQVGLNTDGSPKMVKWPSITERHPEWSARRVYQDMKHEIRTR